MSFSRFRESRAVHLILAILLSVFAVAPLTHPDFFQSHSGYLPVFDLYDLEKNLWGNWGWMPTMGRDFNLLRGDGPVPYLLAESFRWVGLGGVEAVKAVYFLGFVGSALGAYLLGARFYGPQSGLLAAVVYTYLPYHLAAVYVRGAFAEALAFALYPLILLCWHEYMSEGAVWWPALGVVLVAALALTNVGLCVLYALFLLLYTVFLGPSRAAKARSLLVLVVALAVSLLLLLPVVMRHGLALAVHADFGQHLVYPFQLLSPAWGYGASTPDWKDTLPLQLGLAATGLTLVAVMLLAGRGKGEEVATRRRTIFFVVLSLVVILSMLHPAAVIWRISGLSLLLTYPWQMLAFAGVSMSLASGAVVGLARQLGRFQWQAVLITLVILASYGYLEPRFTEVEVGNSPVGVLGGKVALLAYQREGPLLHGATVRLNLCWQSLQPMDTDYTVFVHIVDDEGSIWGQRDAMPLDGQRPTSSWELGEIVEDQYEVTIDAAGPREGYIVQVGMYDSQSGDRLSVAGGGTALTVE